MLAQNTPLQLDHQHNPIVINRSIQKPRHGFINNIKYKGLTISIIFIGYIPQKHQPSINNTTILYIIIINM